MLKLADSPLNDKYLTFFPWFTKFFVVTLMVVNFSVLFLVPWNFLLLLCCYVLLNPTMSSSRAMSPNLYWGWVKGSQLPTALFLIITCWCINHQQLQFRSLGLQIWLPMVVQMHLSSDLHAQMDYESLAWHFFKLVVLLLLTWTADSTGGLWGKGLWSIRWSFLTDNQHRHSDTVNWDL